MHALRRVRRVFVGVETFSTYHVNRLPTFLCETSAKLYVCAGEYVMQYIHKGGARNARQFSCRGSLLLTRTNFPQPPYYSRPCLARTHPPPPCMHSNVAHPLFPQNGRRICPKSSARWTRPKSLRATHVHLSRRICPTARAHLICVCACVC